MATYASYETHLFQPPVLIDSKFVTLPSDDLIATYISHPCMHTPCAFFHVCFYACVKCSDSPEVNVTDVVYIVDDG